MSVTERPLQTPCQWCGGPVRQPSTGRLLRYCDRSCRQRAYEMRTARRRLDDDIDAGVVRAQPAERIVERVVRAKHPRTAAGWESALEELRAQLANGRIGPWDAPRLQRAVALVDTQLRALADRQPPPAVHPVVPQPRRPDVDVRIVTAIEQQIAAAGGALSTTLERLAAGVALGVDELREAVLDLEYAGLLVARRHHTAVSIDELAIHSRFDLSVT